jgi:hypothetical protein
LNRRYPWDALEKVGDFFLWKNLRDEQSVRSQANKQGNRRGVVYRVNKVKRSDKDGRVLVVTLEAELP